MNAAALFLAVFLACAVEAVEATTIVLAVGTTREWGAAIRGVIAALVTLAALIAALGPALSAVPLQPLRLFVGGLLLIFGLQWLVKAVLRASGYKAVHDEAQIFRTQSAAAQAATRQERAGVGDWYAFVVAFKGVLLEGLEVAFIALTFGTNQHNLPLAALAAVTGVVVVAAAGFAIRAPLARVPENTMKFVVGVMLCAFGTFWGAEGAGAHWPGSDAALLVLAPAIAAYALAIVAVLRRIRRSTPTAQQASPAQAVPS